MTDHEADACVLDSKDRIILDSLEHDGRMTLAQLAAATSLSVSATQSRVQKLEHKGVTPATRRFSTTRKVDSR